MICCYNLYHKLHELEPRNLEENRSIADEGVEEERGGKQEQPLEGEGKVAARYP